MERNLYLTSQILDMGIPTVIALNMMDAVEKEGTEIHRGMSRLLDAKSSEYPHSGDG